MFSIDSANKKVVALSKKSFSKLGFSERHDLQEWICGNPEILGEPLLIIQKEFDGFFDTNERLDLLALDSSGNLVIIENKLDDSGRDVVWQALKYVSYCALLKKSEIRDIYQKHLGVAASAEDKLSEFFNNTAFEDIRLNPQDGDQRLILVAANFRKEVTTTVLWLRDHGVDVKCIRVTPYKDGDRLYLDAEQILPVQDIGDYQVRLSAKKQDDVADSKVEAERHKVRRDFWTAALPVVGAKVSMFKSKSPTADHWLTGTSHGGVSFNLQTLKDKALLELYIDTGDAAKNKTVFSKLYAKKEEFESAFASPLDWRELPDKRASRILAVYNGDFSLADSETWEPAINWMAENMKRLSDVFWKPIDAAVKGDQV